MNLPPVGHRRRRTRVHLALAIALATTLSCAFAADPYDLAFCAPVGAYPMSSQERPGFDNLIAEILAEELGARATFVWTRFDDFGIRDTLHAGLCDVAIGISETVDTTLHSVPYLKTPFVFVSRTDRALDVTSLDDPRLHELTVGTYQAGIPSVALRNRGMIENVREFAAIVRPTGVDGHTPILDAVVDGTVDIGIVYGPFAAARATDEAGALSLTAVTPEVDFGSTILQFSRVWTIAVRAHDTALRDRINRALAARWDEVHAAIDAFGVPQLPLSRPTGSRLDPRATAVGVIVPAGTPAALANAPTGDDARRGVAVAENAIATAAARDPFYVLLAHAPSLEAVERAALRLILDEGVDALVGGYDSAEARLLANLAREHGVTFFNVGAETDDLRDARCYPTTLHVAPSATALAHQMVSALPAAGARRAYVIAERGLVVDGTIAALARSFAVRGGTVGDVEWVEPGQFVYFPVLDRVRTSTADTVFLLMSAEDQEALLSQASGLEPHVAITGLSTVRGQSRAYLQRFLQVAPARGGEARIAVWDPALDVPLNATFAARTAEPMEPAAWTTYAGILSAFAAARADALERPSAARTYLTAPGVAIDVGKPNPVRYRTTDGELVQDLFVVAAVEGAGWGRTAIQRTAIAEVLAVLGADTHPSPVVAPTGGCTPR